MEEARKALFEKVVKKYTFQELVRHRTIKGGQFNLIEMISKYPNQGQNFKVFRKSWPTSMYYMIDSVQLYVSLF